VACETLVTTGQVVLAGEVTTTAYVDAAQIARDTIKEIGYIHPDIGFDYHSCGVLTAIHSQSPDIARGVDKAEDDEKEQGAGDQGLMFGYATDETRADAAADPPGPSHRREAGRGALQKGKLPWLRPDGKSQVTIEYVNERPTRVHTVVVSTQHDESVLDKKKDVITEKAKREIIEQVIRPTIPKKLWNDDIIFHINPTGKFVVGGPHGDTGLTGRKIIVDSYGGRGAHGGGAFSGKDPSKVDRSACYMGRYIAKNIVAAGLARSAEVQLAYAIGVANPGQRHRQHRKHGGDSRRSDRRVGEGAFPADAARHHQAPGSAASDLQADRPPRPLRPHPRRRRRLQLGKDRQGRQILSLKSARMTRQTLPRRAQSPIMVAWRRKPKMDSTTSDETGVMWGEGLLDGSEAGQHRG
jgi:S-adenosylmethionine synthetase